MNSTYARALRISQSTLQEDNAGLRGELGKAWIERVSTGPDIAVAKDGEVVG